MPPSRRIARINELLRDELAELLKREINDEAITGVLLSITNVETSPDLHTAHVYYSVYGTDEEKAETGKHLTKAAGFLRRQLMGRLDLRYTPHLEFVFDNSLADGARIMKLMHMVEDQRDAAARNASVELTGPVPEDVTEKPRDQPGREQSEQS
jgi:ribosome-binding factor A